jgi:teichuronic acid biosynthesis glycosyltransferase TuaC
MIRVLMCGPDATSGGVATHTKSLTAELKELGVIIIPYSFSGSNLKKIYQRTVGLFLNSIKKRAEYDIIHVQTSGGIFSFISAITGALASSLLKKKFIFTYHNSKILYPRLFKLCLRRADTIFLVSQLQKDLIQKRYPELVHKVQIIPNGFDQSKFCVKDQRECRVSLRLPTDKKILLTVGNLLDVKGHRYLIEAMEMIKGKRNDVICAIVGTGCLRQELSVQISQSGLDRDIILTGVKPHDEIPLWINACDLFVLPSLRESFGVVQIEAMACGKPVVATRNGGSESIIISHKYGLLCEPANPQDLSNTIIAGLSKRWDNNAISNYASLNYRWDLVALKTKKVYEEVFKEQ